MRTVALATLVFAAGTAHAAPVSHTINTAPVRGYVQNHLVDDKTHTLKLGRALNTSKPPAGVTTLALEKAGETLRGMTGFNRGTKAGNYVAKMGKEVLILTASAPGQKIDGVGYQSSDNAQEFVLRTGKSGLVIARGNLDQSTGKLTFTRSHNGEHTAEVNNAK
jgi:hypothetical protein